MSMTTYLLLIGTAEGGTKANACAAAAQHAAAAAATPKDRILPEREMNGCPFALLSGCGNVGGCNECMGVAMGQSVDRRDAAAHRIIYHT